MTAQGNNGMEIGVAEDIDPHENAELMRDNNEEVEVIRMVHECFERFDGLPGVTNTTPNEEGMEDELQGTHEDLDEWANTHPHVGDEVNDDIADNTEDLLREANTPLFKNSPTNRLQAVLMLLNVCTIFGVSNACVDELLKLLKHDLLPRDNTCPQSHYEAKRLVKKLGLSYNTIHACKNGHCLFRNELKDAKVCPECKESRYVPNSDSIPVKVLRHFPLIPRLLRMYRCKRLAKLMTWHIEGKSKDSTIRSIVDSKAWKHVDARWPEFAQEPRNLRLALALDGVNPFSNQSLSHSTWPVVLLNYNLPPWLVTKRFFVMLSLIIPGKESVKEENIHVYLAPLVEELQRLWEGVKAKDGSILEKTHECVENTHNTNPNFKLKAILMWSIHDFPAYGLLAGQVTKGYRGCPPCGPNVATRRSKSLGKNVYLGHRRYLTMNHPYRRLKSSFDGGEERRGPPQMLLARDILRFAKQREDWLLESPLNKEGDKLDPIHEHGVKRKNALYALPYWKVHTENSFNLIDGDMLWVLFEHQKFTKAAI